MKILTIIEDQDGKTYNMEDIYNKLPDCVSIVISDLEGFAYVMYHGEAIYLRDLFNNN